QKNRANLDVAAQGKTIASFKEIMQILGTFTITVIAWIFFRASSVTEALSYLNGMASKSIISMPTIDIKPIAFIAILVLVEWLQRSKQHGLENINKYLIVRWCIYILIISFIVLFGAQSQSFIYFQF